LGFEVVREDGTAIGLRALVSDDYLVLYEISEKAIKVTNLIDCRTEEFQSLLKGNCLK